MVELDVDATILAERELFRNAPITEALLDIRAILPDHTGLDQLASFHDSVRDRYPNKRDRKIWTGSIHVRAEGPEIAGSSGGIDGFLFSSVDGKNIVQCRLDGFTFNRLKPYDKWETFREEAFKLWQSYVRIAAPKEITRVALRYINRIEIPLPITDFKDYVLTGPEIAPGLPQGLTGFFMQLTIPITDIPAQAIVTETIEPITETKRLPFILDIDVCRQAAFNVAEHDAWEVFEKLHDLKNHIFFKSITPKARELFR